MFNAVGKAITLGLGVLTAGFIQSASADWEANYGGISAGVPQDIVVTLKSNPMANLEQACLAVTFARMLSGNPANNVTLFVTLDGVSLAKDQGKRGYRRICTTPEKMGGEISLIENLEKFLDKDKDGEISLEESKNMMVCPICWGERYGDDEPDYGVLPGLDGVPDTAIGTMMGNADKILDF